MAPRYSKLVTSGRAAAQLGTMQALFPEAGNGDKVAIQVVGFPASKVVTFGKKGCFDCTCGFPFTRGQPCKHVYKALDAKRSGDGPIALPRRSLMNWQKQHEGASCCDLGDLLLLPLGSDERAPVAPVAALKEGTRKKPALELATEQQKPPKKMKTKRGGGGGGGCP